MAMVNSYEDWVSCTKVDFLELNLENINDHGMIEI
jgi:hypothetical protein